MPGIERWLRRPGRCTGISKHTQVENGELAEWSKAAVLKTVDGQPSGGSNPSLSAKYKKGPVVGPFYIWWGVGLGFEPMLIRTVYGADPTGALKCVPFCSRQSGRPIGEANRDVRRTPRRGEVTTKHPSQSQCTGMYRCRGAYGCARVASLSTASSRHGLPRTSSCSSAILFNDSCHFYPSFFHRGSLKKC